MKIEIVKEEETSAFEFKIGSVFIDEDGDVMMIANTAFALTERLAVNLADGGNYLFTKDVNYRGTLKKATLRIEDL